MDMFNSLFATLPVADMATAFKDSNFSGQTVVVLLVLGSVMAWTITVSKLMQLRQASSATARFVASFRAGMSPISFFCERSNADSSPLAPIYREGCEVLDEELQTHGLSAATVAESVSDSHRCLTLNQLEALRAVVDRNVADGVLDLEDRMGLLATAVSAAPFLGLLGTVWGVMDAFNGMAAGGTATLPAVLPGISGSLLTTVVGLLVALPAMIGYNYLSGMIRKLSVQMDNFAQEFISEIQNNYVREG